MILVHEVFRVHHMLPGLLPKSFFQDFSTAHTHHEISSPKMKMLAVMSIPKNLFTSILNQRQQCLNSELLAHARIPEDNFLTGTMKNEQSSVTQGTESSHPNTSARLLSERLSASNSINICSMVIERSWRGVVFFPKILDVSQRNICHLCKTAR